MNKHAKINTNSLVLIFIFFITPFATASVKLDSHGRLIPPDEIHLKQGLKDQGDGYTDIAIRKFKESARFGNNRAKYLLGMYYISEKNWPTAYAWFNLMNSASDEQKSTIEQVKRLITPTEKKQAFKIYQSLKPEYSVLAALDYREKWSKKDKPNGSHIPGAPGMKNFNSYAPVRTNQGGVGIDQTSMIIGETITRQVEDYVFEFKQTIGTVSIGEFETLDSRNSEADKQE